MKRNRIRHEACTQQASRGGRARVALLLELLEDRTVPANIFVTGSVINSTVSADPARFNDGPATPLTMLSADTFLAANLRSAVAGSTGLPGRNTIFLEGGRTYTLSNGELEIEYAPATALTIQSLDANLVTIDPQHTSRVFRIFGGGMTTLDHLNLINGTAPAAAVGDSTIEGGAISNSGNLTVMNSTFSANYTPLDGGAVFNGTGATLNVVASTFRDNLALRNGGGIANLGTATVDSTLLGEALATDDRDFYVRGGAAVNDLIFATVDAQNSGDGDPTLAVLANDGTTQIEFDDDDGPGLNSVVAGAAVPAGQAGNVFYRIERFPGSTLTSYQLYATVVSPAGALAESEANDTSATADAVNFNQLVTGNVADDGSDTDFFSFVVPAGGGTVVVIMDDDPERDVNLTDTELDILGPDGTTVLATGDNSSNQDGNGAGAVTVPAGTCFIRVVGGNDSGDTGTSYRFVVLLTTPADLRLEGEPNDTPAQAVPLAGSQFGYGSLALGAGNKAVAGGGIFSSGVLLEVVNSTVSGNAAGGGGGGGIHVAAGMANLRHTTIVSNAANAPGGGVRQTGGTVTLANSIVSDNRGDDLAGTFTTNGFNLIRNTTGATLNGPATDLMGQDPLLGPLAENGGPTRTHLLGMNSPAFNAGAPNFTPPPAADQRGLARVSGGRLDIGAVEVQVPVPVQAAPVVAPPRVRSIQVASFDAAAALVTFQVTIDRPVAGVDLTDFHLVRRRGLRARIVAVSGSGTDFQVQVKLLSGTGRLRLRLRDDNSIRDNAGAALGGPALGDGTFVGPLLRARALFTGLFDVGLAVTRKR